MNISIDTDRKTIKMSGECSLKELFEQLDNMLPDWKEYKLIQDIAYYPNYNYPIVQLTIVIDNSPYKLKPGEITC